MAAHIITGPIDASDYKTYTFPVLFFKRICDVFDEELKATIEECDDEKLARSMEENFTVYIPEGAHWRDAFSRSHDIGEALKKAFRTIETQNDALYGILGDAQWTNKDRLPDHLIPQLLDHFNRTHLGISNVRVDDMGLAYEFLIKKFADKANKKAGELDFIKIIPMPHRYMLELAAYEAAAPFSGLALCVDAKVEHSLCEYSCE